MREIDFSLLQSFVSGLEQKSFLTFWQMSAISFAWKVPIPTFFSFLSFTEYFVVALANYAHEEFEVASLQSPSYGGAGEYCFQFVYDFYVSFRKINLKLLIVKVYLYNGPFVSLLTVDEY